MTTPTTRSQEPLNHLDPAPREEARHRTSPLLLGALAIALAAFAVWWSTQRDAGGDSAVPALVETAPVPATPAVGDTRDARVASPPRAERIRPLPADRGPRPLAGNPIPEYPRSTLRSGAQGSMTLRIQIDASGMPVEVQVVERSGDRDRNFDRAAMEAVREWRFEPAIRDGKAVSSTVQLPVEFRRG